MIGIRSRLLAILTILQTCNLVLAEQQAPTSSGIKKKWAVSELDIDSFTKLVVSPEGEMLSRKPWFVKYYAPWCGHCQALAPIWDEFNDLYQDQVNVARVDCTSQLGLPLCQEMEVRGYPTLVYYAGLDELSDDEK